MATVSVVLLPGEHFAGDERHRIRTLLGSCVSIVLWHPGQRVGAMSHFVLSGASPRSDGCLNGRYAEDALALMCQGLQALGVEPSACQAKVFGGGAMFAPDPRVRLPDVGRKNGEAARRMLHAQGIPIVSESLFDDGYRNIVFEVRTGGVWVRHARRAPTAREAAR